MTRILIPFTDPAQGQRAVSRVLDEARNDALEIELLAIVEPLTPGKVALFVSPQRADQLVHEAAARWLDPLLARLEAAGVRHRADVAVGAPGKLIAAALQRDDIDRVIVPDDSPGSLWRGFARQRLARMRRSAPVPVSMVR